MILGLLRNPIVIAGIMVVAAFGAIGFAGSMAPGAMIVPEQVSKTYGAYTGTVEFAGGRGNAGMDFVASWDQEGYSETITLTGKLAKTSIVACDTPRHVRYVVYMGSSKLATSPQYDLGTSWATPGAPPVTLPSFTYQFRGVSGGDHVLKATLEVLAPKKAEGLSVACKFSWQEMAVDGARLLDGEGSVKRVSDTNLIEEGKSVKFRVTTGSGGPWKLQVFNGVGNPVCFVLPRTLGVTDNVADHGGSIPNDGRPMPVTGDNCMARWLGQKNTDVTFTVPANAFRADGRNTWRIVLSNEVFGRATDDIFIIDTAAKAPEVPKVTRDPAGEIQQGSRVTLKFASQANPRTQSPVKEFHVTAWYGSTDVIPTSGETLIAAGRVVPATLDGGRYVGSLAIQVNKAADIKYRVIAYDTAGRPSGTQINGAQVKALEEGGMADPNGDSHGTIEVVGATDDVGLGSPKLGPNLDAILVTLLATVIVAALLWYLLPVAVNLRIGAVALVVIAGVAVAFGVVG